MTELRKQFEALPEIKSILIMFYFSQEDNKYKATQHWYLDKVGFINGAWYAFQEQQKKIDEFVNIINDAYMSDGNSSVEIIYDKIQELLK
ncbi:MAG: hypothetical protein RSE18_00510 [Acinetobacter sp.]